MSERNSRPAGNGAANVNAGSGDIAMVPRPRRQQTPVESWARSIIARGRAAGTVPLYGSPAWAALPSSDPRFVAAIALAAEQWRRHRHPATIRRELADELAATRTAEGRRRAEDFAELARGVRALAAIPTQTELEARRSVVAA